MGLLNEIDKMNILELKQFIAQANMILKVKKQIKHANIREHQ